MQLRGVIPATALVSSTVLVASVACSIPALHRNYKTAGSPNAVAKHAATEQPGAKQTVAERSAQHPPAEPLVPRRISAGASPFSRPEDQRAFLEYARVSTQSLNLAKQGDAAAEQGDWAGAQGYYRQALAVWPDDSLALYGMGRCADAAGDTASAIRYYRTATYAEIAPHTPLNAQTNDAVRLMEFVLLLSKGGHEEEALRVYRRAAGLLNYVDGKQDLDVPLPDFGPGGWAYTPQRMQAMAYVGLAVGPGSWDTKKALAELQKASNLAPDSPVPYFYKGRRLAGKPGRSREALAALHMAAQLGDEDTKAAVDKRLKDWSVERNAKVEQEMEDLQKKQAAQK